MKEARRKKYKEKAKEENNVSRGSHKEKSSVRLCHPPGFFQSQEGFSRGCGNVVEMFSYAMRLSSAMRLWIVSRIWILYCMCVIVREVDEGWRMLIGWNGWI